MLRSATADLGLGLGFLGFAFDALFDTHIPQFAGFEDFAALKAFHELGIFVAADDLHTWVLARLLIRVFRLGERL
ncbi:MAG: hypothetical protein WAM04_07210 [Candidatus Sulfotelmatobacter sp.]